MPNLSGLTSGTTAALSLSNLVLVTPQSNVGYQPLNPPNKDGTASTAQNPPKLLFQYEGEQRVTLKSDITDHYVEDNTAIQDQIALKPEMVTTQGFIGELNNVVPTLLAPLKFAADKLTAIGSYAPALSTTALLAYSEAFFLYQTASRVADTAVAAWYGIGDFLSGDNGQNTIDSNGISGFNFATGRVSGVQNKQQTMFQQFYGYWRRRTLFTVQTPWAVFQNMAIDTLSPVQDAETETFTTFEVTFKMIRTASTQTLAGSLISFSGRSAAQSANPTSLGTSSPVSSTSLSSGLSNMGVA